MAHNASSSNQYTLATSFPYQSGPNHGCPQAIVPLTGTKSTITNLLGSLIAYAAMGTFIPTGLAWGWHLLTPNEPFTQGISSSSPYYDTTLKALVLFTDGDNSTTAASNHNNSYFSAYGFLAREPAWHDVQHVHSEHDAEHQDDHAVHEHEANGTPTDRRRIRLYVITFGTLTSATTTTMTNCASVVDGETLYYNAPATPISRTSFRRSAKI